MFGTSWPNQDLIFLSVISTVVWTHYLSNYLYCVFVVVFFLTVMSLSVGDRTLTKFSFQRLSRLFVRKYSNNNLWRCQSHSKLSTICLILRCKGFRRLFVNAWIYFCKEKMYIWCQLFIVTGFLLNLIKSLFYIIIVIKNILFTL